MEMLPPLDQEEQQSKYLPPSVQWRTFLKLHAPTGRGSNGCTDLVTTYFSKTLGRTLKSGRELPIVIADRLSCNLNWKPHTKEQKNIRNNIWVFHYSITRINCSDNRREGQKSTPITAWPRNTVTRRTPSTSGSTARLYLPQQLNGTAI